MLNNHEAMFDTWLKVASQNDKKASDERELVEAMKKLPPDVLFKIANGEMKLGSMMECSPSKTGGPHNLEWLEEFKDTPFFEQALQLEQQAINIEMMRQQSQSQHDAERKEEPNFYDMEDRIRLQKRLLGLQLASTQLQAQGGGMPGAMPGAGGGPDAGPAASLPSTTEAAGGAAQGQTDGKVAFATAALAGTAYGAYKGDETGQAGRGAALGAAGGAVGGLAGTLGGQAIGSSIGGLLGHHLEGQLIGGGLGELAGGAVGIHHAMKRLNAKPGATKEAFDHAAMMGQRMAQSDYDRAITTNSGAEVGQDLAKVAYDWGSGKAGIAGAGLGAAAGMLGAKLTEKKAFDMGGLANMGRQAIGAVAAHPGAAIGAAAGGAAGLAHGLQRDAQGQRHVMSGLAQGAVGAAGGAALGHVAQGAQALHASGLGLGESISGAAGALKNQVQSGVQNAASRVMGKENPAALAQGAAMARPPAPTMAGGMPSTPHPAPTMPMTGAAPPVAAPTSSGVRTAVQGRVVPQGAPPGPPVAAP